MDHEWTMKIAYCKCEAVFISDEPYKYKMQKCFVNIFPGRVRSNTLQHAVHFVLCFMANDLYWQEWDGQVSSAQVGGSVCVCV